jgi:expansin (peptidoglycan-binding protein)
MMRAERIAWVFLFSAGCSAAATQQSVGEGGSRSTSTTTVTTGGGDAEMEGTGGETGGSGCLGEVTEGVGVLEEPLPQISCEEDEDPNGLNVAVSTADFAGTAVCGACVRISGPEGDVLARVVERCEACPSGYMNMSAEVINKIAAVGSAETSMTWSFAACEVSGPFAYRFKEGSNDYWAAIRVRNARLPVAHFEFLKEDGEFQEVFLTAADYFVAGEGMGPGPFTFRITDVLDRQVKDGGIPLTLGEDVQGGSQFPDCP